MKSFWKTYEKFRLSFWHSVAIEWRSIKNDKAIVTTFLSLTLLVLVVYTFIYSNEVVFDVDIAVIDQDNSQASRGYISMLNSTKGISTNTSYAEIESAKRAYYRNEVRGILIIPKDFGIDIRRNRQPAITTYADASNMIFYKNILQEVATVTGYYNAGISIKKELSKGKNFTQASQSYTPIKTVSTSLFNTSSGYATFLIPVLTALVIQLVLLMGIGIINGSVYENKKLLEKFPDLVQPGGTIPVLLGKSYVYTIIFALIIPLQIGIVYSIFTIPFKSSIWNIYFYTLPYILSVVFLGITLSSFFKRREDAIVFIIITSIPALMLSGFSYPMQNFPPFFQFLASLLPSTTGINGFVKLSQMNASFSEILNEWKHLWFLCGFYFITAALVLKYRTHQSINEHS